MALLANITPAPALSASHEAGQLQAAAAGQQMATATDYEQLRTQVQSQLLAIRSSYVQLAADVQVQVLAALVETGLFFMAHFLAHAVGVDEFTAFVLGKALGDGADAVDGVAFNLTKARTDSASGLDAQTVGVGKAAVDSASGAESVQAAIDKRPSDRVDIPDMLGFHMTTGRANATAASDGATLLVGKGLADDVAQADQQVVGLGKARLDMAHTADTSTAQMVKRLQETTGAGDWLDIRTQFHRAYLDSGMASDGLGIALHKSLTDSLDAQARLYVGQTFDNTAPTDAGGAGICISLLEMLKALMDRMGLADQTTVQVGKHLADAPTAADRAAVTVAKGFPVFATPSEALANDTSKVLTHGGDVTEGGFADLQNYASGHYFAQDYTGLRVYF